jgi:sialidase-1
MHAAEGLTLGGHGADVLRALPSRLTVDRDDQRRCGLARELVRAGDRSCVSVLLDILAGDDPHGHIHAAESLYKVCEIGDGEALRRVFETGDNVRLRQMAAGALGRCGNPRAMDYLRTTLSDPDPDLNHLSAWILGVIGDASDLPQLRKNVESVADPLHRSYHEHALAVLGDAGGLAALERNLSHADPAVRTYAATFAGDARAVRLAAKLTALLDDPHFDARIRAAQSLLALTQPPPLDRRAEVSQFVFEATAGNPRYTEGSVLELRDGSLLFAVTEFQGSGSDFAKARIVARNSNDDGRTWGPSRVLQENTGGLNVMSVTLRRLAAPAPPGTIALFYLRKNAYDDLDLYVRFSADEAESFGDPVLVTDAPGYHVVNNDRVTQLSSGRLIAPAASTPDVRKDNHFVCRCWLSDDGGRSWRAGQSAVDLPRRGAMEPEVIELRDGTLLMIVRTQLGYIARSHSTDRGETWSDATSLAVGVRAPEAPATIRRIPSTGDLLLIWNNTYEAGAGHGGKRTPLTAAVSSDEGATWTHVRDLETAPDHTYAYTSVAFVKDRVLLTYWDQPDGKGYSTRFRSLPAAWFYAEDDAR